MKEYEYVIESIADGRVHALKQRITNGLNSPVYVNKDLDNVKQFALEHDIEVAAIGSFYEVVR